MDKSLGFPTLNEKGKDMNERGIFTVGRATTIFIALIGLGLTIAAIVGIVWLIQNPEVIGQFFGNIVNGFNSAK